MNFIELHFRPNLHSFVFFTLRCGLKSKSHLSLQQVLIESTSYNIPVESMQFWESFKNSSVFQDSKPALYYPNRLLLVVPFNPFVPDIESEVAFCYDVRNIIEEAINNTLKGSNYP